MTFFSQIRGFIKRNFLLKVRNKVQTVPEIYNPITLLAVLVLFNYILPSERLDAVVPPVQTFPSDDFIRASGYIVPDTPETRSIGQQLQAVKWLFRDIQYFNSSDDMKVAYLNESSKWSSYLGIEFAKDKFPFQYTLYTAWDSALFSDKSVNLFANGNLCRPNKSYNYESYDKCGGNRVIHNGLATLQYSLDKIIKSVRKARNLLFCRPTLELISVDYVERKSVSDLFYPEHAQESLRQ